ncbi:hypothetical protein VP01_1961g4 [Puccinia sorghi]|uniref:Uncharacterized protein n=1 Tax=Puccinia sorghi TaxID=27349 RepID=A0A0L6VBW3_9BASI|nr:hypothetical protein VP01_1961g4 [Puccinia sorghi]
MLEESGKPNPSMIDQLSKTLGAFDLSPPKELLRSLGAMREGKAGCQKKSRVDEVRERQNNQDSPLWLCIAGICCRMHGTPISKSIGLTLRVLSPVAMSLTDSSPVPLPFSKEVEGQWSPKTSGGNHALASYSNNPMWRITIEEGTQGATRDESARVRFRACLTTIDPNGGLDTSKPVNIFSNATWHHPILSIDTHRFWVPLLLLMFGHKQC